jgi:hypothetical protein
MGTRHASGTDILVIATNRPAEAEKCLSRWRDQRGPTWDAVVLVEDAPYLAGPQPAGVDRRLCWEDIPHYVDDNASGLISRRDSAIKALGFLEAAAMGATRIHTLDDDCYPYMGGPEHHAEALSEGIRVDRWASSVPGMRVRGLPYGPTHGTVRVDLNVGLWGGVADVDSVTELAGLRRSPFPSPNTLQLPESRVLGAEYVPMCGMNLAFTVDVLPLVYFAPMGLGQPLGRFDDIWAGLVAKRGMDHLGLRTGVGLPHVHHERLSDPYANLRKEAVGIQAHEHLWRLVDGLPISRAARTPADVASEIGLHLFKASADFPVEDMRGYMARYGENLVRWAAIAARAVAR